MRPSLARRVGTSVGLSLLFMIVYPVGQLLAGRRQHVPSLYFGWERHVPFVPWAIVPYLSIDLFFVAAPLLARTGRELRAYAVRVAATVGIAGAIFIAFPLQFGFGRPPATGWAGVVFGLFRQMDQPTNALPSLHIALLVVVGEMFLRHARGWLRAGLLAWFGLIAASPWLVHQHHLLDLIAGLALGLVCLALVPDGERLPFERNARVCGYYAAAGLATAALCAWAGRDAWPLWWLAIALLSTAAAYAWVGPAAFGKRDGRLPWTARLLFWPMRVGQHGSLRWYARRSQPYDRLTERVWIGRRLSSREAAAARAAGVGAVVDLTCEFAEPAPFRSSHYLHLPTLDLTAPSPEQIATAVMFIQDHEAAGAVYIHCKAGYSRTAVIAAAYLLATDRASSVDSAIDRLRGARPGLIVRPEARAAIERFSQAQRKTAGEAVGTASPAVVLN